MCAVCGSARMCLNIECVWGDTLLASGWGVSEWDVCVVGAVEGWESVWWVCRWCGIVRWVGE